MSAFIVGKEHIDAIVNTAIRGPEEGYWDFGYYYHGETYHRVLDPDAIGFILWTENLASVAARYPDDTPASRPGPISENIDLEIRDYHFPFTSPPARLTAVSALKQIRCLEYQSCEHDGWETSQAKAFLDALTVHLISALPGYEEAPWGL